MNSCISNIVVIGGGAAAVVVVVGGGGGGAAAAVVVVGVIIRGYNRLQSIYMQRFYGHSETLRVLYLPRCPEFSQLIY